MSTTDSLDCILYTPYGFIIIILSEKNMRELPYFEFR